MASRDSWVFRRGMLSVVELGNLQAASSPALIPARFMRVEGNAICHLLDAVAKNDPIAPDALIQRLELGRECFGAWVNGSIAAYGWVTRGPEWVGEFERELQMPTGEAYIWDCATLPGYRRKGLFTALLYHIVEQLALDGFQRLWIISMLSVPAIGRGAAVAGFQSVVSLTYLRLLDRRGLLIYPQPAVSSTQLIAARHLLMGQHERLYGPLIVSDPAYPVPPDTHFDG